IRHPSNLEAVSIQSSPDSPTQAGRGPRHPDKLSTYVEIRRRSPNTTSPPAKHMEAPSEDTASFFSPCPLHSRLYLCGILFWSRTLPRVPRPSYPNLARVNRPLSRRSALLGLGRSYAPRPFSPFSVARTRHLGLVSCSDKSLDDDGSLSPRPSRSRSCTLSIH